MRRGTGYVATHAQWEGGNGKLFATFPLDRSARPWGPDGGPYLKDDQGSPPEGPPLQAYYRRYAGGGGKPGGPQANVYPIGAYGEGLGENLAALRAWYARQPPEHRALWDGEPTIEEAYDAAFSNPYPGAFYGNEGDVLIDSAAAWDAYFFLLNGALSRGELRMHESWSILLPGDATPTTFHIRWMPGQSAPPPPPPPDDDDEEDPPVPTPKRLSPVPQRVAELRSLIDTAYRASFPIPPWAHRIYKAATLGGLLDLALTELVRAKRKLHGEPEEGPP